MLTALMDAKSGFVAADTAYQLAAYSLCSIYPDGRKLPPLDEGLILRINDVKCEPVRIPKERMEEAADLFLCALKLYRDGVKHGLIKTKGNTLYPMTFLDEGTYYPRVTSILHETLNREGLNNWLLKESIKYTLQEMKKHARTPDDVLDVYEQGLFDPKAGALAHRDKRGGEGHDIHRLIRNYLTGKVVNVEEESVWVQSAYHQFVRWANNHALTLVEGLAETKVYSPEHLFAGTLDAIVTWDGKEA